MEGINKDILREVCVNKQIAFSRYFFKHREGSKFILNPHHEVMARTLDRVISGEITRLIINVPPGYTKTEMTVIDFIARGLCINPKAKFIHASFSKDLAQESSAKIKDVIQSDEYQALWPMTLRNDSKAKGKWYNESGGGMIAVSTGGVVTGFRAGRMSEGFTGCFIADDALKPDDAYSDAKRNRVNNRINNTLKSRLAHPGVPMIFIGQRVHDNDPSAFLLKGGTGEKWHHLILPAEIVEDYKYPEEFKFGIPVEHNLPVGALWDYKASLEELAVMRECDPYTAASQYDQCPTPLGGGIFKDKWWEYYDTDVPPIFEYRLITADTAEKTGTYNDYSVFGCWGVYKKKVYLLDVLRARLEPPDVRRVMWEFHDKHANIHATSGRLNAVYVEDASSGTDTIATCKREGMNIFPIQRHKDKVTRAMDTVPYIASGRVFLPNRASWLSDFKDEMRKFTAIDTHDNDDQVDMFMDGVEKALMPHGNEAGAF